MASLLLIRMAVASTSSCNITLDTAPLVRAGDDYKCLSPVATADACVAACCADTLCLSFSWNDPWNLTSPYMGCEPGVSCCCLKNAVAPTEPNKWPMKIVSGAVQAAPPTPPPPCSSVMDCSLNGECNTVSGKCSCDAGWKGEYCSVLDLVPPATLAGTYQHTVADPSKPTNTSSWGGLPVKGDGDGLYHLFAAQFVQNCTLGGWNPGSVVIRATASTPFGPFSYQETVLGTFHHNPTVRRLTAEQSGVGKPIYVMYMIGADRSPPTGSGSSCSFGPDGDPHHLEGYITMAWADSLLGPWTKTNHTLITSGVPGRWDAMVTNPAPLFPYSNSTAYLFFRGTNWPLDGYERIGLAKADSWQGPYGRVYDDAIFTGRQDDQKTFVEDPHIWVDHKGRGYKGLFHGHFDENGYYGFAEHVEGPWTFRDEPAYTNVVTMADGTTETLMQRERPQLWLDEVTGAPTILFTGVAPPGAGFYGYTYTFAQRIVSS